MMHEIRVCGSMRCWPIRTGLPVVALSFRRHVAAEKWSLSVRYVSHHELMASSTSSDSRESAACSEASIEKERTLKMVWICSFSTRLGTVLRKLNKLAEERIRREIRMTRTVN